MHKDLIDNLVIGAGIAFVVLAIHALTDSASAQLQLLALILAGIALFCVQLALTLRRARRTDPPREEPAEPEQRPSRPRAGRRNPFFRELTHDWTGLDEHSVDSARDAQLLADQDSDSWDERPAPSAQRPKENPQD